MKKYLLLLFIVFIALSVQSQQSASNFFVKQIEGGQISLHAFAGKKIMIITLPTQRNSSTDSLLYSLDTLAHAHINELKVVAVPSMEDGFTSQNSDSLRQWYTSKLGDYIVIADGLHTRKTSGYLQDPLFSWMTDSMQNEVFNIDVEGPGYKFFIDGSGVLYGVLRPQARVSGRSVQNTLSLQ